jgi:hypothetical protein
VKLEYVNELMGEIVGKQAPITTMDLVDPASRMRKTLRRHYRNKRAHYGADLPDVYDPDLRRVFSGSTAHKDNETAAKFIKRKRRAIRDQVAMWTGQHAYTIDLVLKEMIVRCRALHLHVARQEQDLQMDVVLLVTVQVMKFLHSGHHRIAL